MNKMIKKILAAISLAFALSDCGPLPETRTFSLRYETEFNISAPYITEVPKPDSMYVGYTASFTIRQYDTNGIISPTDCSVRITTGVIDPYHYNAIPIYPDRLSGRTTTGLAVRIYLSELCPTLRPTTETFRAEIEGIGPTAGVHLTL